MSLMDIKHYHVFCAPADGPAKCFTCRATDVFSSREAAQKWAAKQRPSGRRFVRSCTGGPSCPGSAMPEAGERPSLPQPKPRKPRPNARVRRLRKAIDVMTPAQLQTLDDYIRLTMKVTAA